MTTNKSNWLALGADNKPQAIFDKHFAVTCPHCNLPTNLSAISIPRFEFLQRFKPKTIGIVYRCDSCNNPVELRFTTAYDFGNHKVFLSDSFEEVERPQQSFEFKYLSGDVAADFREALTCYSHSCFNAFAAMCRRCIQSAAAQLGAPGKDKVLNQIKDLQAMAQIDDETFTIMKQVIIDGHDGAHPYLPTINAERARILLELMKDVVYQLFVRPAKIEEAVALRRSVIEGPNT